MSNKDIISSTDLTTPEEKTELFGQSMRNAALPADVFKGKTIFKAIILKQSAQNLSPDDVSAMIGISDQQAPRTNANAKFNAYRVRIIDENSPHSFLPVPCSVYDSSKPSNHLLINMHTMVFKSVKSGDKLTPGDIVDIRLNNQDFSYNLNYGMIVGDKQSHNKQKLAPEQGIPCISSQSAFEFSSNIATIGQLSSAGTAPENVISNMGIPNAMHYSGQVVLPPTAAYIADLRNYMDANGMETIPIRVTSGFRTAEVQADLMYNYPGGAPALLALYGSSTKVNDFVAAMRKSKAAATEVVVQYWAAGIWFSKHQKNLGLDFQSKDLGDEQLRKFMGAIRATGASALFEPLKCSVGGNGAKPSKRGCGNEHIHVGVPSRYAQVTKEQYKAKIDLMYGLGETDPNATAEYTGEDGSDPLYLPDSSTEG